MKSVLKSTSFAKKTIVREFPKGFKNSALREEIVVSNSSLVKGEAREIYLDGVNISIRNAKVAPPLIIDVEHDFPFLKIHFEIEGSSIYTPKNKDSVVVNIPNGHYNFFFLPKVKGSLQYDSTVRKTLEIVFTKDYLIRVFGKYFKEVSSDFGNALEKNIPFIMWKHSKLITTQLHNIIDSIIKCNYEEGIKKAYLESKITEILTIFFDNLKNKKSVTEITLQPKEHSKIVYAETILHKNIQKPPTISELAIITGINQFKLKQNFKIAFGMPIFAYITKLRMEKAKALIEEKGYTIAETSYAVGYKNPQHFTTAFKKFYNCLPSSFKV